MMLTPPLVHPLLTYSVLLFDCDDTLRTCTVPGQYCPNTPEEWTLAPNVQETLARYDWNRQAWGVVSNQGGVGLRILEPGMAWDLLLDCASLAFGGNLERWRIGDRTRMCPHAPKAGCPCRKPSPWMLLDLIMYYRDRTYPLLTLSDVLYVGDMNSDREAALRAGVTFCYSADFFTGEDPHHAGTV
jgi:D-glycero-D-manno-heptose 1,7-bisphosphate phosphatase